MTGIMFEYAVRVERIHSDKDDGSYQLEGNWHSFSTVNQAIEFCKNTICPKMPYDVFAEWIIQITLNGVELERIDPATWKILAGQDNIRSELKQLIEDFEDGKLQQNDGLMGERNRLIDRLKKL